MGRGAGPPQTANSFIDIHFKHKTGIYLWSVCPHGGCLVPLAAVAYKYNLFLRFNFLP